MFVETACLCGCSTPLGAHFLSGQPFLQTCDAVGINRARVHLFQIVGDNNPSLLSIIAPALAAGDYYLEVVTQFSGSSNVTKEPRTYRFEVALNVPA